MAALDTDADNLYVTVAAKSMRRTPDIARARNESSEAKLIRPAPTEWSILSSSVATEWDHS